MHFFDILITASEKEVLSEDIHTPDCRSKHDYPRSIELRKSFIRTLEKRLTSEFSKRWLASQQGARGKTQRRAIKTLTLNNIESKWRSVLNYEQALTLPSVANVFAHA